MNDGDAERLLAKLRGATGEREWFEFKENKAIPEEIGEYLSALSNSAALVGQARGFVVWGVNNESHEIVGTSFRPHETKVGNEDLEPWLGRLLSPRIDFRVHEHTVGGHHVVIFEIPAANHTPVRFRDTEWIRVGSYRKKLKDYPEKARALWSLLSRSCFEEGLAVEGVTAEQVLELLAVRSYFALARLEVPSTPAAILERFEAEGFIRAGGDGRFDITNLGAILFARDVREVGLRRKGVRSIQYKGTNRLDPIRETEGKRGYAYGFDNLIAHINDKLPQNELIERALRTEQRMYPEVAIRELVANALIHQDFSLTGTGPMVEIFSDRIEITNPGIPLIDTQRFLDAPPQSRNDALAAQMRRLRICEERGSGIDRVIAAVELFQLPAPDFRVTDHHTRVVVYAHRVLADMSRADRIRACYQHAALQWVSNQVMTNATLRKRFAISEKNYSMASRIIAETMKAELIKYADPDNKSKKHAGYIPYWA